MSTDYPAGLRSLFSEKNSLQFGYFSKDPSWSRSTDWGITLTLRADGTCRIDFSSITSSRNNDYSTRSTAEGVWKCTPGEKENQNQVTVTTIQTAMATQSGPCFLPGHKSPSPDTLAFEFSPDPRPTMTPLAAVPGAGSRGRPDLNCTVPLVLGASGCGLPWEWAPGWGPLTSKPPHIYNLPDSNPFRIMRVVSCLNFLLPPTFGVL
ncbi:hypothetical protein Pelo_1704 [Pelomyxa schiedti]|nr:hypothetical protein Pelo_1704 [Pelomyxa schiedti]